VPFPHFRQHPLVRGGHAQTLAGVFWPGKQAPYRAVQRRTCLDDGDVVILHDDTPLAWRPGAPAALLVHGLAGCHLSPYMVRVAGKLNVAGVRTFRMDLRGCGAGEGLARFPYHAGRSDDVLTALRDVCARCPDSRVSLIGFSLGGNLVLKLLGESPGARPPQLRCAAAVNPSIDLAASARAMEKPIARYYNRHLVGLLWKQLQRRNELFPDSPRCDAPRMPEGLVQFDELFTARVGGFDSAEHYYACSSAAQFLPSVAISTLILAASDDPLVPAHVFAGIRCSPSIVLHMADGGGHLGYVARRGVDPDRRWMDWRIVDWVTAQ
jgi:predicted alpha/beta-fold hydrolase